MVILQGIAKEYRSGLIILRQFLNLGGRGKLQAWEKLDGVDNEGSSFIFFKTSGIKEESGKFVIDGNDPGEKAHRVRVVVLS